MRKFPSWLIAFTISFFACAALAQSAVKITAVDPSTGANGTLRNVIVDSQGRLVVVTAGGSSDAGSTTSTTPVYNAPCSVTADTTAALVPNTVTAFSVSFVSVQWVRICNSLRNTGSPLMTCSVSGADPTTDVTSPGIVLAPGDCFVTPPTPQGVRCISDVAMYLNFTRCNK